MQGPASWGKQINRADVFIHPEYNDNTLRNDIALMKLINAPENLFSDPFVAPIALPTENFNLFDTFGTIVSLLYFFFTNNSSMLINFFEQTDWIWTGIR